MLKMGAPVCNNRSRLVPCRCMTAPSWWLPHCFVAGGGARGLAMSAAGGQNAPCRAQGGEPAARAACAKMMRCIDLGRVDGLGLHQNERCRHIGAWRRRWCCRFRRGRQGAPGPRGGVGRPVPDRLARRARGLTRVRIRLPSRTVFESVEKECKFPAKALDSRISGFFRCIGATGDCPMRKARIRLRRSVICRVADTPMTTTNKGNQP